MTRFLLMVLLTGFFAGHALAESKASADQKLDAKRLRELLPEMLASTDPQMVVNALHIIDKDLFCKRDVSVKLLDHVQKNLERLLEDPKRSGFRARRFACRTLGSAKRETAVPVLIKALADPEMDWDFHGDGEAAEVNWFAVWRDADEALRQITGAKPIAKPHWSGPKKGEREAVRKAWMDWHKKNSAK